LVILRVLLGLDGIPSITSGDLDTPAGVPSFTRMSVEAVGDHLLAAFLLDRFNSCLPNVSH
jgi:hypothetical protein